MSRRDYLQSTWLAKVSHRLEELVEYERHLERELLFLRRQAEFSLGMQASTAHNSNDEIQERISQYWALLPAGKQRHQVDSEYREFVSGALSTLLQALVEHPAIFGAIRPNPDGRLVFGLDMGTSRQSGYPVSRLMEGLLFYALEHTPGAAAEALTELIDRGVSRDLKAHRIILFRGLHVERRYDFSDSLSVIPFDEIRQLMPNDRIRSMLDEEKDTGRGPIGAVVAEAKWGPVFSQRGGEEPGPEEKDDWPSWPETFRDDALLLMDLIAVTHRSPVVSTGMQTSAIEHWIEQLVGRVWRDSKEFRKVVGVNTLRLQPPTAPASSQEKLAECKWLFSRMRSGDISLRSAAARLAASLARTGMLATFDRRVDVAIGLETMYQPDVKRGKKDQLSRRARELVGQTRADKNWVRRTVDSIYGARSDVVHGRQPSDSDQAYLDGLELAYRSLSHLVRHGTPSNW